MKRVLAVIAVALISAGVVAQVARQTQYYGRDGAPCCSSMTYGNSTQYYGANGAPAGKANYSQPIMDRALLSALPHRILWTQQISFGPMAWVLHSIQGGN